MFERRRGRRRGSINELLLEDAKGGPDDLSAGLGQIRRADHRLDPGRRRLRHRRVRLGGSNCALVDAGRGTRVPGPARLRRPNGKASSASRRRPDGHPRPSVLRTPGPERPGLRHLPSTGRWDEPVRGLGSAPVGRDERQGPPVCGARRLQLPQPAAGRARVPQLAPGQGSVPHRPALAAPRPEGPARPARLRHRGGSRPDRLQPQRPLGPALGIARHIGVPPPPARGQFQVHPGDWFRDGPQGGPAPADRSRDQKTLQPQPDGGRAGVEPGRPDARGWPDPPADGPRPGPRADRPDRRLRTADLCGPAERRRGRRFGRRRR